MKNDYVILILSCASYSDLWSNHIHLLDTFWSNHSDYLLVSDDNGLFDLISFEQLLVIKKDMSSRLIDALQRVKSKYVFLTFDDYYLKKNVDQSKFEKILNYIKEHDIDYCGFHRNIKKRKDVICKELKLSSLSLEETYQINFYSSIWKREALISCLRQKEDIWKAEVLLTKRARSNNLKAIACYDKSVLSFKDIVRKGKYLISGKHFIKRHKLYLSSRKTRTIFETIGLGIKTAVSKMSPSFIKPFLKKLYRKSGGKIYSDYDEEE